MNKLYKSAMFTDIHFGRRNNSIIHNRDCLDYIHWFCNFVKADPEIDHVIFLGDWYQNRSALDISTIKISQLAARELNKLGMPVYFIIGNHDLYHKHSREIYSTFKFNEFENFILIDQPEVRKEIGNGCLLAPFLFPKEYYEMEQYSKLKVWFGHFEFRGFYITGYTNIKMLSGPQPDDFSGPDFIFSGHFHKRQANKNIIYIGNTFPLDFSDIGDNERGLTIFNHKTTDCEFYDWEDCPKFIRMKLSEIIDKIKNNERIFQPKTSVKCLIDFPMSYEQSVHIKNKLKHDYDLRLFDLEESSEIKESLQENEEQIDWENEELTNVKGLVVKMIESIESEHIDNDLLIEIYKDIKRE